MRPATVWLLRYFPYSTLVKNQSLFLRLSAVIFTATLVYVFFEIGFIHPLPLLAFALAFTLIFISSYLPRKETKITSLVTQTGALELIDLSPLPIFTYEKREDDIYIRFANKACHSMFSEGKTSLIGKPINRLVMLEDEEEMLTVCLETLESDEQGKNHTFFIRGRNMDGSIIKLMCATSQIKWLEQNIGLCFLFDISKSDNQYSEMQTHMHEGHQSTLVAGIAHDFRNMLTSIIGTAEALQFNLDDEKTIKQLEVIIDAGERGSNTITDLLSISSGKQQDKETQFRDITHDIRSIVSLLRIQLPPNVKLTYHISPHLPHINMSTTQLEQILMNLVNNAAQAMDKEKGTIAISVSTADAQDSCLENTALKIVVSDNGCGISEDNLPYVMDNFWTLRKDSGGTGLGMPMVKRVVHGLQGKLEIKSQLGIGTHICMCFPAENQSITASETTTKQSSQPKANVATKTTTTTLQPQSCTILLVDDQPSVLHVQQMLLEAMGHTVITAMHGEDALKTFGEKHDDIDMLVTDFKMPGMDGVDLAIKAREIKHNVPLLMITAYGETEKLMQAEDLNMTIILKPTNLKKLSDAIAETQLKYPNHFS